MSRQLAKQQKNLETTKHYPSLGIAFIKHELSAAGRVWLLLKAHDQPGRGWLDIGDVRELLTACDSPWKLFSRRRLRQIWTTGDGLLWDRADGKIWLYSPARVAIALNSGRLRGSPVELPIAALLGGISQARASFFGAWHTGQGNDQPIGQARIRELTGIPEATQRRYNQVAGIKAERQIAVSGAEFTQANIQDLAYQHGRVFAFRDYKGMRGKRGALTVAWHLPNIYKPSYSRASKGRLKKHNRRIDLVNKGVQGNGPKFERIYHLEGAAAAKAFNRDSKRDAYFPKSRLWGVIAVQ